MILTIQMKRETAEWLLERLKHNYHPGDKVVAAMELTLSLSRALASASEPHNPQADFGQTK